MECLERKVYNALRLHVIPDFSLTLGPAHVALKNDNLAKKFPSELEFKLLLGRMVLEFAPFYSPLRFTCREFPDTYTLGIWGANIHLYKMEHAN